jgi:nucleoside-diphosphate-sugar epimerase
LPVKVVRPFNTYGPRQSARAIIPTIITQLLNDVGAIKLGNLDPTRDFTFVLDTVKGFIEIFKSDKLFGQITNIGMNNEVSISGLVKLIAQLMNKKAEIVIEQERQRPEISEVKRLHCNNSKLLENTNWKPEYSLRQGLLKTIEWIVSHQHSYKTGIYNV